MLSHHTSMCMIRRKQSILYQFSLVGVYQGAKPHIYCDTCDNQKPRIHDYDETYH